MKYTSCQENAKNELEHFLLGSEDVIILSAPAGRGKSYLLDTMLGDLDEVNQLAKILDVPQLNKVSMTAMSNKAARVINGVTFDSLLGLRPKPNFKTGKTYRQRIGGKGRPQANSIIVLDEAGMLDSDGLKHLAELTHGCKVILSCDRYQLPPVGEAESPIFNMGIRMVEMETPVRQSEGSPLLLLCDALREGVKNQTLTDIIESDEVYYVGDDEAKHFFENMTDEDRVIGYTNDFAIRLNQIVRNFKGIDGFWQPGELLVSNGILRQNEQILLNNEDTLMVQDVGSETINEWGIHCTELYTSKGGFLVPNNPSDVSTLLAKYKRAQDWRSWYGLKETVPDLRGTHTVTAHKSQGSTYNNVLINLNNLKKAYWQDKNLFYRLLYVAISRAKGKVLLYGSLF